MVWVLTGAPQGMPRQSWNSGGSSIRPSAHKLLGEPQIAGIEDLHLGLDAIGLDELGLLAQLRRRLDDDGVAVAEIERAAVERADLRAQLRDMEKPLDRADQIGDWPH